MGVTDLNQYRERRETEDTPHLSGKAVCLGCRHEWVAVAIAGTVSELKCPSCQTYRGVMKATCEPAEGIERFACNCGCHVFQVTRVGVMCIYCGVVTGFSELAED